MLEPKPPPSRPALDRYRVWHFPYALDTNAMSLAMEECIGTHDFTSFRGQHSQTVNLICTISHFSLRSDATALTIRVEGNRFLKQMVRALVGTLVEVGQDKRSPESLREVLDAKNRQAAGRTAPPHGLYLTHVLY